MADTERIVDLTPTKGMNLGSMAKESGSPFIQNVIPSNRELVVRPGFGTVRRYGTTLNAGRVSADSRSTYGLGAPIGATHVRTPWGTDQILAIHTVFAETATMSSSLSTIIHGVSAVVHDLHTGQFAEFVLYEQGARDTDLRRVYPNYATRSDKGDLSRWVTPLVAPTWATFATPLGGRGAVLVAIEHIGLWTYRPVEFLGPVDRKSQGINHEQLPFGPGEQAAFTPTTMCDGVWVADGLAYVRPEEFGQVLAMSTIESRVVYAVRNTLLFADPGRPDNIVTDNFFVLPTQDDITCLATVADLLFVATANACWVFRTNVGDSRFSGSLVQVSSTIGCVSNRSSVASDLGVMFASVAGVYAYQGGTVLKQLSAEVDRLWSDPQSLQMALTDYYVANGHTGLANEQLPARIDVRKQMATSRLAWSQDRETLFCVGDDVTLCWTANFGWHIWYFKTHAGNHTAVQGVANIGKPVMVSVGDDVFLVGGVDISSFSDDSARPTFIRDGSCYLLQLGRGGALDRSIDTELEDVREVIGGWQRRMSGPGGTFYVGKPIVVAPGYATFDTLSFGPTITETSYWFPVSFDLALTYGAAYNTGNPPPSAFALWFTFDNTKWTPCCVTANPGDPEYGQVDAVAPNERIGSKFGFRIGGVPVPGTQITIHAGGVPDPTGDQVRIEFDGAGGLWSSAPFVNIGPLGPQPLVYIGFTLKPNIAPSLELVMAVQKAFYDTGMAGVDANCLSWQYKTQALASRNPEDNKAQCVDWAVKSAEMRMGGMQFAVRGVFLEVMHFGNQTGGDALKPNWLYGPLNTATSTDMRDYSGQAVDFTATIPGNTEQRALGPVARLLPTNGTTMVNKVGSGSARWGDIGNVNAGNLLIDDAAVDTVGTTDGSRGEHGSVMVHGTLDAPGEGVRLSKVEAVLRVTGARRRWR